MRKKGAAAPLPIERFDLFPSAGFPDLSTEILCTDKARGKRKAVSPSRIYHKANIC